MSTEQTDMSGDSQKKIVPSDNGQSELLQRLSKSSLSPETQAKLAQLKRLKNSTPSVGEQEMMGFTGPIIL